jgi:hypothetical protein
MCRFVNAFHLRLRLWRFCGISSMLRSSSSSQLAAWLEQTTQLHFNLNQRAVREKMLHSDARSS